MDRLGTIPKVAARRRHHMSWWLALCVAALSGPAQGFVLLSGPEEARLPVTPESPEIAFVYQTTAPTIKDKDKFEDGRYTGMSDEQLFPIILQLAMDRWNAVPGNFARLKVGEANDGAQFNGEDKTFSIVFGDSNFSTAALAYPTIEDGKIIDCDIKVGNRSTSAQSLAYTVLHELGHCLGLGHYHTNYNAVMGYSRSSRSLKLGADDMAGVIFLYPDPNADNIQPKELVNCGVVAGPASQRGGIAFVLLFGIPIVGVFLSRLRSGLRTSL